MSIGAAVDDGFGAGQDLYRRADAALYEAKVGGRNQTKRAPVGAGDWQGRVAA